MFEGEQCSINDRSLASLRTLAKDVWVVAFIGYLLILWCLYMAT
jgi:hypothetical protein